MSYLAGIDLGSTTLKAVIYDLAGNVVASACRPTEQAHPDSAHPEWTVWMPDQIWSGSAAAMKEAVSQLDDPRKVKGVAVTGMGMDGVPVDEHGQWLYPFISWHCPRTQPQFDWWSTAHYGGEDLFHRRQHLVALLDRAASAVDGRAPAGDPPAHSQVAADRGFRQHDAVREAGNGLHDGLLHAPVRPAPARLVGRDAAPVRHRQAVAGGLPSKRHARSARSPRPRLGQRGSRQARRWCWAATITCAARCRLGRSGPAWSWM